MNPNINPSGNKVPDLRKGSVRKVKNTKFENVLYIVSVICMIVAIIDSCVFLFAPEYFVSLLVLFPLAIVFLSFGIEILLQKKKKYGFSQTDKTIAICALITSGVLFLLSIIFFFEDVI